METRDKVIYWISTGLISALMMMSAIMYFANYEMVSATFTKLGFPVWIIYPLAVAKILAIAMILSKKWPLLKEWAYAGLCFDLILAAAAHISIEDGDHTAALVGLVLLIVSRVYEPKVNASKY